MASKRAIAALLAHSRPASSPTALSLGLRHSSSASSSTGALAYKALHRKVSPLPTESVPTWSAGAAVSSIIYETPAPSTAKPHKQILNCLVQNEPGVLARVSGTLAARGFNIESLVVAKTEVEGLSRMTLVIQGQDGVVEQARRQLEDLVETWAVINYTDTPLIQRELLLAKISILGPEYFREFLEYHSGKVREAEDNGLEPVSSDEAISEYHPSSLAPSEALRHKHRHMEAITYLTHQFGGKVLDISYNNCIVELSAKSSRVDAFLKLIEPFGILESARTGKFETSSATLANVGRIDGSSSHRASQQQGRRERGRRHCRCQHFTSKLIVGHGVCLLWSDHFE
jgi:acetolactate synthase-1/3 small subunit